MAGSNRRYSLAIIALPFLFMVMSGLARANTIVVNTTSGESELAPLCSLPDAITAHNILGTVVGSGCGPGSATDTILFGVTGTIFIDEPLEIASGTLAIDGPDFGCSGAGPCGITIDGEGTVQIIRADAGTSVFLNALTFNHGFAITSAIATNTGGGAVYADGTDLEINDCLFVNNTVTGSPITTATAPVVPISGGLGGAIYGNSGNVVIVNSTFANNTAVGGTIFCAADGIQNTTSGAPICAADGILGESEGGAIYDAGATIKITNCTIANNSAQSGGGYAQEVLSPILPIKGTILQSNTGGNCGGVIAGDVGFNISSDDTCPFPQATSLILTNSLLEPLANNGGPTDTFALETSPAASPAIDKIPVAMCTDQQMTPQPLEIDQRFFGRPDPANLNTCDSGAYEVDAVAPIVLAKGTERVQIARNPGTPNTDKVNIGLTFIYNGDPDCDLGPMGDEDALNFGFGIALVEGTCASLPSSGLFVLLDPFVVHTVNHQSYGTFSEVNGPETVSARLVALATPVGACGAWTLNLEVAGLNTPALGLGGGNPFAILISDLEDAEQCFDVTNAIVGTQIPTPSHSVRRGVRRQNRR
jgi:hypothetical protein